MRVYSCKSPKTVYNRYIGRYVVAPCGKCEACLDARAARWVTRLELEQYFTKYTFFATFQYDEQHVPQMIRLRSEDSSYITSEYKDVAYIDSETGLIVSYYDDSVTGKSPKDLKYCYDTKVLNVLSVRDFQLFIKKLRDYGKRKYNANFRYYIALEYGPSTFRPHSHGLFFTNSSLLAQNFSELFSDCWEHGNVFDPHICHGSAASYVASYVNSFTHLPAIYTHKDLRQKSLFSKCPPIGVFQFSDSEIREIFDKAVSEIRIFSPTKNEFVVTPLFRCLQDRLFPRFQRFGLLSPDDRRTLCNLLFEFLDALRECSYRDSYGNELCFSAETFADFLIYKYVYWSVNTSWIHYYFADILFDSKKIQAVSDKWILSHPYFGKWFNISTHFDDKVLVFNRDSLLRFCRVLLRWYHNSLKFNVSLFYYANQVSLYYDNLQVSQFSNWLYFQNEYFKEHDVKEFLCFDYQFIELTNDKYPCDIPSWCLFYLNEYGYTPGSDGKYHLLLRYVYDYNDLCKTHDYINWQNTKTKKQNDYLLKNSSKFQNVINYYEQK